MRKPLSLLTLYLGIINSLMSITITVPDNYESIQEAIDASANGDTVLVKPGKYYENIDFLGKDIVVGSLYMTDRDRANIEETIIDGNHNGSVVKFSDIENYSTSLIGFTIQKGGGLLHALGSGLYHGGGIWCHNSNPTLKNLIIRNNTASSGGGIYCADSKPIIDSVEIKNNLAINSGGGLYCESNYIFSGIKTQGIRISNSKFENNHGKLTGGAIYSEYERFQMYNCVIAKNTSDYGAGIRAWRCKFIISQSTIWDNEAQLEGGIVNIGLSSLLFVNSIIWGNVPQSISYIDGAELFNDVIITYSNVQNDLSDPNLSLALWKGEQNVEDHPLMNSKNYKLEKESPAIDAGTLSYIWEKNKVFFFDPDTITIHPDEYFGPAPDMGAYEFYPEQNANGIIEKTSNPIDVQINIDTYSNRVKIDFLLPTISPVDLIIFNSLGQRLHAKSYNHIHQKRFSHIWDYGSVKPGVYTLRIESRDRSFAKTFVIK